jgi:hypothetical protein
VIDIVEIVHPGGEYRRLNPARDARLALARKRRMRWIYKWRHGLPCRSQPAHADRGKLRTICAWERFGR